MAPAIRAKPRPRAKPLHSPKTLLRDLLDSVPPQFATILVLQENHEILLATIIALFKDEFIPGRFSPITCLLMTIAHCLLSPIGPFRSHFRSPWFPPLPGFRNRTNIHDEAILARQASLPEALFHEWNTPSAHMLLPHLIEKLLPLKFDLPPRYIGINYRDHAVYILDDKHYLYSCHAPGKEYVRTCTPATLLACWSLTRPTAPDPFLETLPQRMPPNFNTPFKILKAMWPLLSGLKTLPNPGHASFMSTRAHPGSKISIHDSLRHFEFHQCLLRMIPNDQSSAQFLGPLSSLRSFTSVRLIPCNHPELETLHFGTISVDLTRVIQTIFQTDDDTPYGAQHPTVLRLKALPAEIVLMIIRHSITLLPSSCFCHSLSSEHFNQRPPPPHPRDIYIYPLGVQHHRDAHGNDRLTLRVFTHDERKSDPPHTSMTIDSTYEIETLPQILCKCHLQIPSLDPEFHTGQEDFKFNAWKPPIHATTLTQYHRSPEERYTHPHCECQHPNRIIGRPPVRRNHHRSMIH